MAPQDATELVNLLTETQQAMVDELHALIDTMPEIPLSPLDVMRDKISAAGFSCDEITGRKFRLAVDDNGNHVLVPRTGYSKQRVVG